MRKAIGSLLIVFSIPLLIFLFHKISLEFVDAQKFSAQFEDSVQLENTTSQIPALLTDKNGTIFSEEYSEWREPTILADVPKFAQKLFIYSEDENFYEHVGFDLTAIARAFMVNRESGELSQGGSTITQQLVRMRYLSQEKSYERKILEIVYSYELERKSTKDEILNMYLNEMYFANGVYGIGGAATYYFNQPITKLSNAQLAFIAAIPNNPSLYDPLRHFDNTKKRQERLLDKMVANDVLSEKAANKIKKEAITLQLKKKKQNYPAYSTYVINELKQLVAQQHGYTSLMKKAKTTQQKLKVQQRLTQKVNDLLNDGVIIHTALDATKQIKDTQQIDSFLKKYNQLQSAAVVTDNATREVVSVYAGRDYKKYDFNRAYQAYRQPGSAFKPLIVYGPYLEKFDATEDTVVEGSAFCHNNYCPANYGHVKIGNISIGDSFKNSYNTVAIRLFDKVGVKKSFDYLNDFTFDQITKADYQYPAALGGLINGVTPAQMTDAFTSFIDGSYVRQHAIRSVKTRDGKLLYEWNTKPKQIWSTSTVATIRTMMADVVNNGTGKAIHSIGTYTGVKTGTTNNYRDFWVAGLTDEYTTAVWLGYDTPQNMHAIEKKYIHHHIFNTLMN